MDSSCLRKRVRKTKTLLRHHGEKDIHCSCTNLGIFEIIKAKDKHERQLNSFRVLSDRYKVLSEHEETIDIMN